MTIEPCYRCLIFNFASEFVSATSGNKRNFCLKYLKMRRKWEEACLPVNAMASFG